MRHTVATLVLATTLAAPAAAQQNPLEAARELYASARYDEALAVLNGLRPSIGNRSDLRSVEQYRSLCLLALGRGTEAEAAIAAVVAADPLYQPSEAEASPRVRTAFSEVRQRQLPEIATARYAAAKATFDGRNHVEAERQFRELLRLLDDPEMHGRMADLRVLAAGFLDLSVAAAAPPPSKAEEPARSSPPALPPPPPPPDHVFTAEDSSVVAPVPVKQAVPRVPTAIASQTRDRGLLEIVVDELGRVSSMTMRVSVHPLFDAQLLSAAREWRYKPATLNGRSVKYRKLVQITVAR